MNIQMLKRMKFDASPLQKTWVLSDENQNTRYKHKTNFQLHIWSSIKSANGEIFDGLILYAHDLGQGTFS